MQLYVKTGCSFCARTIAVLDAYGLEYETKNVSDPEVVQELITLGGKKREPFLVDGNTMMYESRNIIEYIEQKYGMKEGDVQKKPRMYYVRGANVCPS